jgi:hypothetical protein
MNRSVILTSILFYEHREQRYLMTKMNEERHSVMYNSPLDYSKYGLFPFLCNGDGSHYARVYKQCYVLIFWGLKFCFLQIELY